MPHLNPELPRLHAVTDSAILALPDFYERAAAIAAAGSVAVHVRGRVGGRALGETALRLREILSPTRARLFVNDRVDIALAVDAHGVHLPETGLPTEAARRLVGADRWIGRSVHVPAAAAPALSAGADYAFLGPIFATESHPQRAPLGPGVFQEAGARVLGIGGITPERAHACAEAGAYGVAAVRALWGASDPGAAAAALLLSFTA